MVPTPPPRSSALFGLGGQLSLERKLPLLMMGGLVAILGISLLLTYQTLASSARDAAAVRLSRATRQLAASIEAAMNQRVAAQRRAVADPAVRRVLQAARQGARTAAPNAAIDMSSELGPDMIAARAALLPLTASIDSTLPIELWSDDGRLVLRVTRDTVAHSLAGDLPDMSPSARATGTRFLRPDSTLIEPFYPYAGRVFFGISTPVYDGPVRLGYVSERRRVVTASNAEQSLKELFGDDVTGQYHNRTGDFWSSLSGAVLSPLRRSDPASTDSVFEAQRDGEDPVFATEAAIRGTPWVIVLQLPADAVFARARTTMVRLAALSVLLVVAGALASWMVSRRITRPLTELSTAAEAFAHGDVTQIVDESGGDEVAQLARTFNYMRGEITASRAELEMQFEEAQSVAEELEQANEQLREAMEAADNANRAKSDFLAVMSHELRTPLNAIGGYVQLLELGVHGPVNDAQRDALGRVARSQQRLLTLINDVLNFTKLDAGHVDYHWTDFPLDAALTALEPMIAPQVRARGLTFTYVASEPSLTVHADQDRLQQVVLNLLSNAIKFTPEGGRVTLDSVATKDAVLIRVRDTGRGIAPERVRTIFEPFVQVDRALNRPHDGVGLGLSISRELARGMGGDLIVESEAGIGSVFTVKVLRTPPAMTGDGRVSWTTITPDRTTAVRRGNA